MVSFQDTTITIMMVSAEVILEAAEVSGILAMAMEVMEDITMTTLGARRRRRTSGIAMDRHLGLPILTAAAAAVTSATVTRTASRPRGAPTGKLISP